MANNDNYSKYYVYYQTDKAIKPYKNIIFINKSIFALWKQFRSKYIFYSYRGDKVNFFKFSRKQIVLDTMHGSPLKNIGYLTGNSRFKKLWRYENTFTHILCLSDFFKDIVKKSFGAKENQCLVLGYPRNDYIYANSKVLTKLNIEKPSYIKIILWMPTWRGNIKSNKNNQSSIDFPIINIGNIRRLNDYLIKESILIIIKPHPIQLELEILKQNYSNIRILKNLDLDKRDIELYETFNEVDVLLTDYSSVYFDFLLTMKPIGFTIDDFDSYGDKRGFVVDNPLDIMPGEKIETIEGLISFIEDIKDGNDKYYGERKKINDLANRYQDGNSTKRLVEYLGM